MNFFHRMLAHLSIGVMIVGMVSVVIAAPIPKGNSLMYSYEKGFDTIKQGRKIRSKDSSGQGCWNRPSQGADGYSFALHEPKEADCFSMVVGETTWMYAPGCTSFGFSGNRIPNGLCSVDDQLMTNLGNMIVRSSDPFLGRVDVPVQISGTQKPLPSVVSVNQQETTFLNTFSSPIRMNHPLMPQDVRFDRMSHELFDADDADGVSLVQDFDHQLVMSGKLAHLIPKTAKDPRDFELGDLVFLLLFAIVLEKKQIKGLLHGIRHGVRHGVRHFRMF